MPDSSHSEPSKSSQSPDTGPGGAKPQGKRVSGRLAILSVYGLALAMAGIVFWFGKQEKREWDHISVSGLGGDTVKIDHPDSLRALVSSWPGSFTQVSRISGPNGDRFAVVVPCFNETPTLAFEIDAEPNPDSGGASPGPRPVSAPRLLCPFCESQDSLFLRAVHIPSLAPLARQAQPDTSPALYRLHFKAVSRSDGAQKTLQVSPQDSLQGGADSSDTPSPAAREWPEFLFAPVGRIILNSPTQTLVGPALGAVQEGDTTWFLPQSATSLLETVRAEEESPEGCAPD